MWMADKNTLAYCSMVFTHFHTSLIFVAKTAAYSYNITKDYQKHSSLLQHGFNYGCRLELSKSDIFGDGYEKT